MAEHSASHGEEHSGGHHAPKKKVKPAALIYGPEHEKLYKAAIASISLEEHKKLAEEHGAGLSPAYDAFKTATKGKELDKWEDAVKVLTDAVIQYKKNANVPFSDKQEHRYYSEGDVDQVLNYLLNQKTFGSKDEILYLIGKGEGFKVLDKVLEHEYEKKMEYKLRDDLKKMVPEEDDHKTLLGLVNYHFKTTGEKVKEGVPESQATRDGITRLMAKVHGKALLEQYQFGESEKKGDRGGHGGGH